MRVSLRRIATAASTIIVAIVLAILVPVSQLHTVSTQIECCCPDPEQCKCPDHNPDEGTQPMMKACHKTSQDFVAPVLSVFVPPAIEVVRAPLVRALDPVYPLRSPHPPPVTRRPDAPS